MKTQVKFVNASLVSVVNGTIAVKDANEGIHTFINASVVSVNNGTIIIESEWMPKEGELIKMEGNNTNCYAIFKETKGYYLCYHGYKLFNGNKLIRNTNMWDTRGVFISPVTPEEQKEFDDFCKSKGVVWNKKTLQWEKYKWEPKRDEKYYFIDDAGRVMWSLHNSYAVDRPRIKCGNCFQTEQQAKEVAEKVKELLKSL